jgi:hypothetical protein
MLGHTEYIPVMISRLLKKPICGVSLILRRCIPGTHSDPFGLPEHVPDLTAQDFKGFASGHPASSMGQAFEQPARFFQHAITAVRFDLMGGLNGRLTFDTRAET